MATAYPWGGTENLGAEQFRKPHAAKPQPVSRTRRTSKAAMVDFYTVKRIDNSRLVRRVEPVKLRNLYKTVALGGIIAAFCMLYVYQHFRCIDQSFQLEDLKAKTVQAKNLNSKLKLEIAYLRDPHRIDVIARRELGLTQPTASQLREYSSTDGSELAAIEYPRANHAP